MGAVNTQPEARTEAEEDEGKLDDGSLLDAASQRFTGSLQLARIPGRTILPVGTSQLASTPFLDLVAIKVNLTYKSISCVKCGYLLDPDELGHIYKKHEFRTVLKLPQHTVHLDRCLAGDRQLDEGIRCVVLEDVRHLLALEPLVPLPTRVQVFEAWESSQGDAAVPLPLLQGCDVYCKKECLECHKFFTNPKAQASHATWHAKQGQTVEFEDAYVQEPVRDLRTGRSFERKVNCLCVTRRTSQLTTILHNTGLHPSPRRRCARQHHRASRCYAGCTGRVAWCQNGDPTPPD